MPPKLIPIGRAFYALGLIGIGIQHFIFSDFIDVILPAWPHAIPGRTAAYALGALIIAAGTTILVDFHARATAIATGVALLFLVIVDDIPAQLAANPTMLAVWSNTFKALTLAGGAWAIAESIPKPAGALERILPIGRYFFPITMVTFGIEHFLYPQFVATLVPKWIPGSFFWTYFAGIALIAGGAAMIVKILPRVAALLLGIMIFLWLLMLHIPRALADPHSGKGNEWTSVCEALAFSGIAFILAALPATRAAEYYSDLPSRLVAKGSSTPSALPPRETAGPR